MPRPPERSPGDSQTPLIVVTGASGVGKTTLVHALDDQHLLGVRCYYFDSVGVPEPMRAQFGSGEVTRGRMVLIDCSHEVREARLKGDRGQADLASPRMAQWAAYLRGQADALGLPIVDTSTLSVAEATRILVDHVRKL